LGEATGAVSRLFTLLLEACREMRLPLPTVPF
jgi:hypothetical protein